MDEIEQRLLAEQRRLLPAEWWLVVHTASYKTLKPISVSVYSHAAGRDPVHPLDIRVELSGRDSCDRQPEIHLECPATARSVLGVPTPSVGTGRVEMSWFRMRTEEGQSDRLLVGVISHRQVVAGHCDYWRDGGFTLTVVPPDFWKWWNDGTAMLGY